MRKSLVAAVAVLASLVVASAASAHHVDAVASTATCTGVTAKLSGFNKGDGPVTWNVKADGAQTNAAVEPAFSGDKTITATYPTALAGPAPHVVVFTASWPTQGKNNGTFTKTVTGCPAPPVKLPCPDQPPTAPCNCPPGPAGPAGPPGVNTNTVITVVENHETVTYVDKSCTSKRVFKLTIAQRLPDDDVFKENAGQRIVKARIVWRGANSSHENRTKRANAVLRLGHRGETDFRHERLRVSASFHNVVVVPGVTRVIDLYVTLANGETAHLIRKVRLCMPFRDGDLNAPTDIPQNGHSNGSAADEAQAASKAPGYRKAVI